MAFIDIEHGSAFRCYDILEKFFFFFAWGYKIAWRSI